jgi:hypothetical protein
MGWKEESDRQFYLNPFQAIDDEPAARRAAGASAWVGGYLAFSYTVQALVVYFTGKDTQGNAGAAVLAVEIVALLFALFLTWRIVVRQPFWAALVVLLWFSLEMAMKTMLIIGGQQVGIMWIGVFVALQLSAVVGVRGSWALRRYRRVVKDEAVASVFGSR